MWKVWPKVQNLTETVLNGKGAEVYKLVVTVCGLLLAGAIAGFFQFTYCDIKKKGHLAIGHFTTLLEFLVIGTLLLVVVECLRKCPATSGFGLWPFWILGVLYLSLIFYDIYDFMKRENSDGQVSEEHNMNEDKPRSTLARDITLVVVGALAGSVPVIFSTIYQSGQQFKLAESTIITELQLRTAGLFDEAVYSAETLIDKYGVVAVQEANIPTDEIEAFNLILKDLNAQLSKLYITIPDEHYENIRQAASGVLKLKELKCKVLLEMRKTQFPKTVYTKEDDIRFLNYIKKK
jgi:hypothetical protein